MLDFYSIDRERKFVELLDYTIGEPDDNNRFEILDKDNNCVGRIKYVVLKKENKKKGTKTIYGYDMLINDSNIFYNQERRINDEKGNIIDSFEIPYNFKIKDENGDMNEVEFNLGEHPGISIRNNSLVEFNLSPNRLYLEFASQTENYYTRETVLYNNYRIPKCAYQLKYFKKDFNIKNKIIIREIGCVKNNNNNNTISLYEKTFVDSNLIYTNFNKVEGTVEEFANKCDMAKEAFSHFRYLVNNILPFNREVISLLIDKNKEKKRMISPFIDNFKEEIEEKMILKNKKGE